MLVDFLISICITIAGGWCVCVWGAGIDIGEMASFFIYNFPKTISDNAHSAQREEWNWR